MEKYFYLVIFAPLIASLVASIFAPFKKVEFIGWLNSFFIASSMYGSLNLFYIVYILEHDIHFRLFEWIAVGNLDIHFSFLIDEVSVVMLNVVTVVSTMVHIYSIAYMEDDKSFNRYFAYLSLFVFSMIVLVLADNFAVLFIGWEAVGLCSWLLIGFWYEKKEANFAANEAFIMNRIADVGLLLAMFLIYWNLGSLNYELVFSQVATLENSTLVMIGLLLFLGAMGKSAQFPLHTWLSDAMQGPTPVSALIHAATMVTAGVYLLIRANELYVLVPEVGYFIACLGTFVAIFAASMAIVNNDMKKIIAYSTLSQLGYMFVAVGLQAYWVALFHLMTHAFFKSVLFLGAGNVMHALKDEVDIRKMGGLYKNMKITCIMMIIASLALSGVFPLAGFFSKDKILESAFRGNEFALWFILFLGAGLTAFYSFRLIMKIFFVKPDTQTQYLDVHEAKSFVLVSMLPLVIFSIIIGWFGKFFESFVTRNLPTWEANLSYFQTWLLILLTTILVLISILFAVYKYKKDGFTQKFRENMIYKILINQYYIPKFYDEFIVKPYYKLSVWVYKIIEVRIIDAFIDGIAHFIKNLGAKVRVIQVGNLSSSLKLMSIGLILGLVFAIVLAIL